MQGISSPLRPCVPAGIKETDFTLLTQRRIRMMIALSVLAAWIIMSVLFSFFWGAVIRRGMDGPHRARRSLAGISGTGTDSAHSDWAAPVRAATPDRAKVLRRSGSRIGDSSHNEARAGALSGSLPRAQYRSSWSNPSVCIENISTSRETCGTSGSFYPEQVFFPNSRFVLSTSADNS